MKLFLKYLLSLLILIYASDKIISGALDKLISKSKFRYINLFNENPEVYLIGNSRGVNSLLERKFKNDYEIDVLNLSYNGLTPGEIISLIQHINKKKLLLIEISSLLNQTSIRNDLGRFNSIKNLRTKTFIGEIFNLVYFNNELTYRLIYYIFKSDKTWINKNIIDNISLQYYKNNKVKESFTLRNFWYVKNELDKMNIDYLFYLAPIHHLKKRSIDNFEEINSTLKNNLGPRYLDISDLISFDKGFADLLHTNHNSVDLIHESINNFLKSNSKINKF
ncbi:MAG: hypothetical protein P8I02_03075 [Flavobacteriales bacterium]|nr:hypothetical protein [Flavobacteriales bacterium]